MGRRNSLTQTYRLVPIIIASLLIFLVIAGLAILTWSLIVFLGKNQVGEGAVLPAFIWLIGLFLSAGLMTIFTRGGTVFPALFLALITVVLSCFFAGEGVLSFGGVLLKILLSLLATAFGFSIAKLLLMMRGKISAPRRKMPIDKRSSSDIFDDMDLSADDEEYVGFKEYHR